MLQHPSKYHHPNPLSQFLALHSSQAVHHNAQLHAHSLPTAAVSAAAAAAVNGHNPFHQQHQAIVAANQHHQQQQHQQHLISSPHGHTHLIDAAANATSLDAGKSFTIAAILGLQKSAIESTRKEYNNVINLSLHGDNGQQLLTASDEMHKADSVLASNNNSGGGNGVGAANKFNNFNCDSNAALVQRYCSVTSSFVAAASESHQHHQHQQQSHPHQVLATSHAARANSFAAAAAVAAAAAAAAANGGAAPSALQSLQQLHQQHAQQSNLSFQRDKVKSESSSKKTSLKNKRVRTIFTPEQLERLEAEFERQQYMVGPERLYLAHTLQLTEAQVKVWFQNRRIKWRKHHLEITQQRLAMLRQTQLPGTSAAIATATAAGGVTGPPSSPSCEAESEEIKHSEIDMDMGQLSGDASGQASESDLSICNDSMDGDSVMDGGEVT